MVISSGCLDAWPLGVRGCAGFLLQRFCGFACRLLSDPKFQSTLRFVLDESVGSFAKVPKLDSSEEAGRQVVSAHRTISNCLFFSRLGNFWNHRYCNGCSARAYNLDVRHVLK